MQITVYKSATVYSLGKANRHEMALIREIKDFAENPIVFATTGFEYSTAKRTL